LSRAEKGGEERLEDRAKRKTNKTGINQIHMRYRNRKDRANALFESAAPGVEL